MTLELWSDWLGLASGVAFSTPAWKLLQLQRKAKTVVDVADQVGDAEFRQDADSAAAGVNRWPSQFNRTDARLTGAGFLLLFASFAAKLADSYLS